MDTYKCDLTKICVRIPIPLRICIKDNEEYETKNDRYTKIRSITCKYRSNRRHFISKFLMENVSEYYSNYKS